MPTIHNPTIRQFNMPARAEEGRKILRPNSKLEVSPSYLDALFNEKKRSGQPTGWALRLEKTSQGARVRGPTGVAGTFESEIRAYREANRRKVNEAKVRAEEAEQKNRDLERRLADLEGRKRKADDPPKGDEGKPAETKGQTEPKGADKPDDGGQTKPGVGSEPKSGGGKGGGKKS